MRRKLLRLLIPGAVVGMMATLAGLSRWLRWVPREAMPVVWLLFVAVVLGAIAWGLFWVLPRGHRKWGVPFVVAALVQLVGVVLYATGSWPDWSDPLWTTGIVLLLGIVVVVTIAVVGWVLLMSRQAAIRQGIASEDVSEAELERIRRDFLDAIGKLRRELGRGALYQLPWVLITGRTGGGKTEAIRSSRLGKICGDNWRKGIGGTHTLDFFFTDRMIFLDTPGEWVAEEQEKRKEELWGRVIRALRRWRGRFPLDAMLVVVPADDLLELPEDELVAQAERIRRVIVRFQEELELRLPVYVVVSKLDLVRGFREFFGKLQPRQQDEMMGWSEPRADRVDPDRSVRRGMSRLIRRLARERLRMLGGRALSSRAARNLLLFPREMQRMAEPLATFVETLFEREGLEEPTPFRGVYFSSALQRGNPLGKLLEEMGQRLGVEVPEQEEPVERKRRSYFLRDLFYHRIPRDRGLAGHSVVHWFRRRRDTALVGFLPAIVALTLLGWAMLAYSLNTRVFEDVRREVPEVLRQLEEIEARQAPAGERVRDALIPLGMLRQYHDDLTKPSLARGFGMRRSGRLSAHLEELEAEWFRRLVLRPLVDGLRAQVEEGATGGCAGAAARLDAIVRLARIGRSARPEEWAGLFDVLGWDPGRKEDVEDFETLAGLAWSLRNLLERVFPVEALNGTVEQVGTLCGNELQRSPWRRYRQWAAGCRRPRGRRLDSCWNELLRLAGREGDFEETRQRLEVLSTDLADLSQRLPGLRDGSSLGLPTRSGGGAAEGVDCERPFEALWKEMRGFVEACRGALAGGGGDCSPTAFAGIRSEWDENLPRRCLPEEELLALDDVARGYVAVRQLAGQGGEEPAVGSGQAQRLPGFTASIDGAFLAPGCERAKARWKDLRARAGRRGQPPAARAWLSGRAAGFQKEYCRRFEGEWRKVLATLEMPLGDGSDLGEGLEQLATCADLEQDLQPWMDAARCAADWCGIGPVAGGKDLEDYCSWLGKLAGEYRSCRASLGGCRLSGCAERTDGCPLGKRLEQLLGRFAPGLRAPLCEPLQRAAGAVVPETIARETWNAMAGKFEAIRERFPLKPRARRAADAAELRALFGWETGLVPRLDAMRNVLPAAQRDWVRRAVSISELLFDRGSDEWRVLPFRVKSVEVTTEPAKKPPWEPSEVRLLAGAAVSRWTSPEGKKRRKAKATAWQPGDGQELSVEFDPTLEGEAGVVVRVRNRPSLIKRVFSSKKTPEDVRLASREGAWALAALMAEGCRAEGDTTVSCSFAGTREEETIHVNLVLEVPGGRAFLEDLRRLLKQGLAAPPAWEGQ